MTSQHPGNDVPREAEKSSVQKTRSWAGGAASRLAHALGGASACGAEPWRRVVGALPVEAQVQGVLREDQVLRHQVVAAGEFWLLLALGRDQARLLVQPWCKKRLCVKSPQQCGEERALPQRCRGTAVPLMCTFLLLRSSSLSSLRAQ